MRQAFDEADCGPGDVDLVCAHGTGTALGDPIEITVGASLLSLRREQAEMIAEQQEGLNGGLWDQSLAITVQIR